MSIAILPAHTRNDTQAQCPSCGKLVKCHSEITQLAFDPRYVQIIHDECGTKWRRYIDENRTEILEQSK